MFARNIKQVFFQLLLFCEFSSKVKLNEALPIMWKVPHLMLKTSLEVLHHSTNLDWNQLQLAMVFL